MKAAWIGVGGTVLGVILTLGAQPVATKWLGPPTEGTYTVEHNCFSPSNLDPAVAKQIVSFPCQLRIAHVEGPAVQKLSVVLTSRHRLVDLKAERNDENAAPVLSND